MIDLDGYDSTKPGNIKKHGNEYGDEHREPCPSWIVRTTRWARTDGHAILIWVEQYGGPINSHLTVAGDALGNKLDPVLL